MNERSSALDALRGFAIILMVLSGSIVFGILPGWMYHGQTPPPTHAFNPEIAGITWVDLVFPFFLFAMGAALPFAMKKRIDSGESKLKLVYRAVIRGFQLTFFAIFIQHFYPWVLSSPQDARAWALSLLSFLLLFPMFMRIPLKIPAYVHSGIKIAAYILAFVLMNKVTYANGRVFDPAFSNIIILVLANMAIFGTLAYLFTAGNRWARVGILPFVMAVFLGSSIEGSITKAIFDFTPISWMYSFNYLKYLFIVIPGTIAGEYVYDWMKGSITLPSGKEKDKEQKLTPFILILSVAFVVVNICCLYARYLYINLSINCILFISGYLILKKIDTRNSRLWQKLFLAGGYLIFLGLFFEPYQEGIKKDPSTYSYYFVTAGLAFMALLAFNIICDYYKCKKSTGFLVMSGQNPMIAYVVSGLFTIPVLNLTGIYPLFDYFGQNAWLGFLQGVIITAIAILITMFFTKIKWFWRT